jgi:hypothetical protein
MIERNLLPFICLVRFRFEYVQQGDLAPVFAASLR